MHDISEPTATSVLLTDIWEKQNKTKQTNKQTKKRKKEKIQNQIKTKPHTHEIKINLLKRDLFLGL